MVARAGLYHAKLNIRHKSPKILKKTRHIYVPRNYFLNHQICKRKILVEILINRYDHLNLRAGPGGEKNFDTFYFNIK